MAEQNRMDIESLTRGLDDRRKKVIQQLLSTIAMQAEVIQDLVWEAEIDTQAAWFRQQALSGLSLTQLAAVLHQPVVQGPSLQDLTRAIRQMQQRIRSATQARAVFDTILSFGLKLAPLII